MTRGPVDAVVIGAGPNGLVAANALVDAGWEVVLVEANDVVGGAVRSAEVTAPGFCNDLFSAFYPLAAASPVIRGLDLEAHGLRWTQAPTVLAHVLPDDRAAVLHRTPEDTAAGLDEFAAGDGDAWLELFEQWQRVRDPLLDALFTPFPPVRPSLRLLRSLGAADGLELMRQAVLPVHRLAEERFDGEGAAVLLTGNAMHSDIGPDSAGSGMFGWLLCMLGQDVGFPVPQGGAQRLADALVVAVPRRRRRAAHRPPGDGHRGPRRAGDRRTPCRRHPRRTPSGPCSRTSTPRPSTASWSARSTSRRGSATTWSASTGTTRRSSSTGRSASRCHGPRPGRTAPGPSTWASTAPGSSTSPPTCRPERAPREPFVLFGQMSTADPTQVAAGHRERRGPTPTCPTGSRGTRTRSTW